MKMSLIYILMLAALMDCKHGGYYHINENLFLKGERIGDISATELKETSGIETSSENPGMLWTHNDSGNDPEIFLISKDGAIVMTVRLAGVKNDDWEDIVLANNKNGSFIYIGDIGDNMGRRKKLSIHKIREPRYKGEPELEIGQEAIKTMTFTYANGARDAETLLINSDTEELIIVTKRERNCFVYAFPFQASPKEMIKIEPAGKIPLQELTGGDINKSGEILLKNYKQVFYWSASDVSAVKRIINGPDYRIPYEEEPQGEAICWDSNGGFLTISEFHPFSKQYIYLYQRAE